MKAKTFDINSNHFVYFIAWDDNTIEFKNKINYGNVIDIADASKIIWKYLNIPNDFRKIDFVTDNNWIRNFNNGNDLENKLPLSVFDTCIADGFKYKNVFINWFSESFKNNNFCLFVFSKSKKYKSLHNEDIMYDIMFDYTHNSNKYYII